MILFATYSRGSCPLTAGRLPLPTAHCIRPYPHSLPGDEEQEGRDPLTVVSLSILFRRRLDEFTNNS